MFVTIWLHNDIDGNATDYHDMITQLRCIINTIDTFTDRDECVDFLTDIYSENVCMVISGELCQDVVPFIHNLTQLQTILIFGGNKTHHDQWTADYPKVKDLFTEGLRPSVKHLNKQSNKVNRTPCP